MSVTKLSEGGRVVVPANLREKYGLAIGDTLVWTESELGLTLHSKKAALRRVQAIAAKYKRPGIDEVDEFLRDKRKEAARE